MIDLILHCATSAVCYTGLVTAGLATTVTDPVTQTVTTAPNPGVDIVPWMASGQFQTVAPVYDQGSPAAVVTPPAYLPGYVLKVRFSGAQADSDSITPDPNLTTNQLRDQSTRSRLVARFKSNGTPVAYAGGLIHGWKLGGVEVLRADEVRDWVTSKGFTWHEWAGGDSQ